MANFSIKNVAIKGISACVPKNIESNINYPYLTCDEIEKFISATGVEQRRIAPPDVCASDLCHVAADKLLNDLQWDRNSIDVLVFVSQTPDYLLPTTSTILQDRLNLSTQCVCFDIPLGCSGYVYGLSVITAMMSASGLKRGLLLVGDTLSKLVSPTDKSTAPLFGDGGTATALEIGETESPMLFNLGTDGAGYKAIIIPDGGCRNLAKTASFISKTYEEGVERNDYQMALDGMEVFSFGITQAPKTVNSLLDGFNINKDAIDYFVFHQANMKMNKMIAKKLKLPEDKVPLSLKYFGNTSSATIPLTIVAQLHNSMRMEPQRMVLCGFGVGLSWGAVYLETNRILCPQLIEI